MSSEKAILGYWAIRGLASPIRHLLEYVGQPYEDKLYVQGDAPNFSTASWLGEKYTLGLEFPNLPYYIEPNGLKLTQTKAIIRYLARKHGLAGSKEEDYIRIDLLDGVIEDYRAAFSRICYNPNFAQLRLEYEETLPLKLDSLESSLQGKKWLLGETFSYVDFLLYEFCYINLVLNPSCLDDYPSLKKHYANFEAIPQIAQYKKSSRYMARPLNNKIAHFQ
eukprot:TRINITY_DN2110_c0_g1_i1.p1 TRINITY_DN2110_c0_g1~~TRINITY_DN2110_c0_g1_i1.p1  ORF type:complete len:221 (-),score=31.91 TRINITY_DN2110_c0_g1_i1:16-678(-)